MSSHRERAGLDLVLRELYLKKQWLDTIIAGIESATQSADHQFIESIAKVLGDARLKKPTVDLQGRQREQLARLAQLVGRRGARRRLHDATPDLH